MPNTPDALASVVRRVLWQEQAPPLPDRRDIELPGSADFVVVGGGYTVVAGVRYHFV